MVPADKCYFVDSTAEMVELTNPRYICPDDLPNEVQEAYKVLGSKYLSDAVSFHPIKDKEYQQAELMDTERTKHWGMYVIWLREAVTDGAITLEYVCTN